MFKIVTINPIMNLMIITIIIIIIIIIIIVIIFFFFFLFDSSLLNEPSSLLTSHCSKIVDEDRDEMMNFIPVTIMMKMIKRMQLIWM